VSQITNQKIEKIKNAFSMAIDRIPINSDKFNELVSELTRCVFEYDMFPKVEKIEKLCENIELRVFYPKDKLYCKDIVFTVFAKVIDVVDNDKIVSTVLNYKLIDIAIER